MTKNEIQFIMLLKSLCDNELANINSFKYKRDCIYCYGDDKNTVIYHFKLCEDETIGNIAHLMLDSFTLQDDNIFNVGMFTNYTRPVLMANEVLDKELFKSAILEIINIITDRGGVVPFDCDLSKIYYNGL